MPTFDYGYDSVGNRKWTKRDGGNGDVFDYDQADQAIVAQLDIASPEATAAGSPTIVYDANGNRNSFAPYGQVEQYATDEFNRYKNRTINGTTTNAIYDGNSNMTGGLDGSSYAYDAQNRLTSATSGGVTDTFTYDALNRQVSRTKSGTTTYDVHDAARIQSATRRSRCTPALLYVRHKAAVPLIEISCRADARNLERLPPCS